MNLQELRSAILLSEPLYVSDIVQTEILATMPDWMSSQFANMRINWLGSRLWGRSFKWGAGELELGHRRGDHLASRPHIHGMTIDQAAELLRRSVEGTALHELGHAMLDLHLETLPDQEQFWAQMREIVQREGIPSSYVSPGSDEDPLEWPDMLHEVFAEMVRYLFVDDQLPDEMPELHQLTIDVLNSVHARMSPDG